MEVADQSAPARAATLPIAAGIGLGLGAIALGCYAYVTRVPTGQSEVYLAPAGQLLLRSFVALCVVVGGTVVIGLFGLRGRVLPVYAAWLFALTVGIAAYGYIGKTPNDRLLLISGPGARPAVALAQLGWVLAACAALAVLVGTIMTARTKGRARGPVAVGLVAAGIVVTVVAGGVVSTVSSVGVEHATTAARISVPPLPTRVGTDVAYTLDGLKSPTVLSAGPGFVVTLDEAVIAYDGATGAERWRMPFGDLPARCTDAALSSTGISDDSVVVVKCTRPPNDRGADDRPNSSDDEKGPYTTFLVGLDAGTGERLWINDGGWALVGRASTDADVLAAVSRDQVAALDPRTGRIIWAQPRLDERACNRDWYDASGSTVTVLVGCGRSFHLVDANGDTRIDLASQPGYPSGDVELEVVATEGDVVAMTADSRDQPSSHALVSIDTRTRTIHVVPTGYLPAVSPTDGLSLIPGPVLGLDDDRHAHTANVYLVSEQRVVQVAGIDALDEPRVQRWAVVGDRLVTATAFLEDYVNVVASAPRDGGPVTTQPNPCGDSAGVVTVPGAVLLVCGRYAPGSTSINSYSVLGMR